MSQFESFSGQLLKNISVLQEQLDELSSKQQDLHKLITASRDGSLTEEEYADVKMMVTYNSKLLSIRTSMVNMSLKSKQLRKRSDKLKATKLEYLSKVESIRRMEQERNLSIAAKVSDPIALNDQQQQQQQQQSQSPSPSSSSSPIRVSSPIILDHSTTAAAAAAATTTVVSMPTGTAENIVEENTAPLLSTAAAAVTTSPSPLQISNLSRTASTSSLTPTATPSPSESSSGISLVKKKKKKKPKAREVEIGGDDDGPAWIPKRTLSKKP
ncbi:unnamed protein product [Absidia cylindrospora]